MAYLVKNNLKKVLNDTILYQDDTKTIKKYIFYLNIYASPAACLLDLVILYTQILSIKLTSRPSLILQQISVSFNL